MLNSSAKFPLSSGSFSTGSAPRLYLHRETFQTCLGLLLRTNAAACTCGKPAQFSSTHFKNCCPIKLQSALLHLHLTAALAARVQLLEPKLGQRVARAAGYYWRSPGLSACFRR
ncbi:unnamed protein product [Lampetra planeri]